MLNQTVAVRCSLACLGLALPMMVLASAPVYVLLILGLGFGLYGVYGEKSIRHELVNPWMLTIALVLAWLGVGSLMGINPPYNLRHWGVVVGLVLSGLGLYRIFRTVGKEGYDTWVVWLVDGLVAAYILAIFTFIADPWFITWGFYLSEDSWVTMRLRSFSSVVAVVSPFAMLYWLKDNQGRLSLNNRALMWFGITALMVFICAGRAGWLGFAAGTLLMLVMLTRYHGLKIKWKLAAASSLAVLCVAIPLFLYVFGWDRFAERIGVITPERGPGGGRLDIWAQAWHAFWDHPLMGIGVEGFRFLPHADAHPHNFILQLAAEGGLATLVTVLGCLLGVLYIWLKACRNHVEMVPAAAALLAFMVCALLNKSIFNPSWLVYLLVVITIGEAIRRR